MEHERRWKRAEALKRLESDGAGRGTSIASKLVMAPLRLLAAAALAFCFVGVPSTAMSEEASSFDREAATSALKAVDLHRCRGKATEHGEGHVKVTFVPAGKASSVVIDRGPMVGGRAAKCIAKAFKKARVPPFKGPAVNVGKTFQFD